MAAPDVMADLSQELRPLRQLMIQVSPVDLASVDNVEKLQSVLSQCQQALQANRDEENILQLLKYGLEKLIIESLHAFTDQPDAVNESNESLFDVILETINVLAESGAKACELIVPNIVVELLEILTFTVFSFQQKMEALKSVNILLECSTFVVKEKLLVKQSFLEILKKLFNLILFIGDYEFQVGVVECLFRLIPRKVRRMIGETIISDPRQLATFLLIKDSHFETDCRTFLNNLNSSLGDRKRVMSIPCVSVQLGSRSLQKPSDQGYNEFWVDFNYGSQRLTVFCEQDSTVQCSQQTQDDDLWETISVLNSDINDYHFTESDRNVYGIFDLTADVTQIFSQMKNIEGDKLVIVADRAYNLPLAVNRTFSTQQMKKVSSVCEPISVKTSESNKLMCGDIELVPSSQMSVASSIISGTPRKMKVSIPYVPMSTPASIIPLKGILGRIKEQPESQVPKENFGKINEQPNINEPQVKKVRASIALADITSGSSNKHKGLKSPVTPVIKSNVGKRKVKTPVVVIEPDDRNQQLKTDQQKTDDNLNPNKENKHPHGSDENVIPDSMPSQSFKKIEKKQGKHKLREVDSGICLVEPEQLTIQPCDQDSKQSRINERRESTTSISKQKSSQIKSTRSQLMTASEATRLCLESDDNISELSSEIISVHEENVLQDIMEDEPVITKVHQVPSKSARQKPKNSKYSVPCEQKTIIVENHVKPVLIIEPDDSGQPTKYGKGKGRTLYHYDKPLCATPVSEKHKMRYSFATSKSKQLNSKNEITPLVEKCDFNNSKKSVNSDQQRKRIHKGKSEMELTVDNSVTGDQQNTRHKSEIVGKNKPKMDVSDNNNTCDVIVDANKTKCIDKQTEHTTSSEMNKTLPLPDASLQLSNSVETEVHNKTNHKRGTRKGKKSNVVEEISTRSLRKRPADNNKKVNQKITLVQSTSVENISYESSQKTHKTDNSYSAKLSSSKKAFFIETRTAVTNSYLSFKRNNQTPSTHEDPYQFDEDSVSMATAKTVDPIQNKFFKSRNKQKSAINSSKSDSCVANSKKEKSTIKTPYKQQSLWQHKKQTSEPFAGFSDEEDTGSTTIESTKTNKNTSMLNSKQFSKSLPNIARKEREMPSKETHRGKAPRQAKSIKSYYISSNDNTGDEETQISTKSTSDKQQKNIDTFHSLTTPSWKQATLEKINKKIRDSDQFTIFNRDSWGEGKSTEKTPKFNLDISKYPLQTPASEKQRKTGTEKDDAEKSGSVLETFTAICTGLIMDSTERNKDINVTTEADNKSSKFCDASKNMRKKKDEMSSRKSVDGRSEVSWLEKKSSGKRRKFKKTYQVDREGRKSKKYLIEKEEENETSLSEEESDEEEKMKSAIIPKNFYKGKETPKLQTSTTPRGVTPSYKKYISPLDIRLRQTPKTSYSPGLPSLCVVSEDAASAPNTQIKKQVKIQTKQYQCSEEEDASLPVSVVPSQDISVEPSYSQITSLSDFLKMATPKHIKNILDGEDDEEDDVEDDDNKELEEKPISQQEADDEETGNSSDDQNISQAGFISGPSSRVRPTKSTLKRKYSHIDDISEGEDEENNMTDESNVSSQEDADNSTFMPRKLFKTDNNVVNKILESVKIPVNTPRNKMDKANCKLQESRSKVVEQHGSKYSDAKSISTEHTDGSLEWDLDNNEEEMSLKTGVTAVVRTFGVDIQNQLKAKRRQLESITQETVKSSNKMVGKMWSKQKHKRNHVLEKYQDKMVEELKTLEKEITILKDEEDRTLNFFNQQMKLLRKYRDSQEKRVDNMSHNQEQLMAELNCVDAEGDEQQQQFKTVLKKDMTALQQRLLKETQQQQLMNVRKCLQTLFL